MLRTRRVRVAATPPKRRPPAQVFPPLTAAQQALVLTGLDYAHKMSIKMARWLAYHSFASPSRDQIQDLYDQMVGAAYAGLCRGAQGFEAKRGWTFLTYASDWVLHAIQAELPYLGLFVGPKNLKSAARHMIRLNSCLLSEQYVNDFQDGQTFDVLNHRQAIYAQALERHESRKTCRRLLARLAAVLDDRHLTILFQRFVIGRTLQEIGDRLRLSKERVRQIERQAIRKIRRRPQLMRWLSRHYSPCRDEPAPSDFGRNIAFPIS